MGKFETVDMAEDGAFDEARKDAHLVLRLLSGRMALIRCHFTLDFDPHEVLPDTNKGAIISTTSAQIHSSIKRFDFHRFYYHRFVPKQRITFTV